MFHEPPTHSSFGPSAHLGGTDVIDASLGAIEEARMWLAPVSDLRAILGHVRRVHVPADTLEDIMVAMLWNAALAFDEPDPDHNVVLLSTRMRDGDVVITVSHNGRQLSDSDCQRVLMPAYRDGHLGFELSSLHRMLRPLGGYLKIRKAHGGGMVFEVVL